MRGGAASRDEVWPPLPLEEWADTFATLHLWTQVVGKVRLACAPPQNHWWHVPLYLTSRGLSTSTVPGGDRTFQIDFDFLAHELWVSVSDGSSSHFSLDAMPVADFYRRVMEVLHSLGLPVRIWTRPQEVEVAIPFEEDRVHASYDPDAARRHWQILSQSERVLQELRAGFLGKTSPIHFFWGSFDLAFSCFSGRRAPPHPGGILNLADRVAREAYSHEVYSVGFWPGGGALPEPAYYAYVYPEPAGFAEAAVEPGGAVYSRELGEFVLPYEAVRSAPDPDAALLAFARSTYRAAADAGRWPREELEPSTES